MISKTTKLIVFFSIFIVVIVGLAWFDVDPKISDFVYENHALMWVVFGLFLSIILLNAVVCVIEQINSFIRNRNETGRIRRRLKNMSPMEKFVLSKFLIEKKSECLLDSSEIAVAWLESVDFISKCGHSSSGAMGVTEYPRSS